ncbi:MAG: lysozyme inhibitor LprI family protein [Hyphomicrobiaceae bacterium]
MQGQSSLRTVALAAGAVTAVGMATLVATSGTAQAYSKPSFNCHYAKNRTERAICRSWRLARLDRRLAYWYDKAMLRASYFDQERWVRGQQRRWLRWRNACGGNKRCIGRKYRQRIRTLRNYFTHV